MLTGLLSQKKNNTHKTNFSSPKKTKLHTTIKNYKKKYYFGISEREKDTNEKIVLIRKYASNLKLIYNGLDDDP